MPTGEGTTQGAADRDRSAAAVLLLITGLAHAALGVAGITGVAAFEANVAEIEDTVPGGLYAGLGFWGGLMLVLGIAEVLSARAILAGSRHGWLAGQISAFCGLGGAVFTLAIFRVPVLLTIPLGLLAAHLLARRSGGGQA
jgi:hypothetical protein